jgi:peptide/nickel transport system substrate-binding protein
MARGSVLGAVAAALCAALLLAASGTARPIKEGGTFRVGMSGGLLVSIDPAFPGGAGLSHVLGATCAALMNQPDKPLPARLSLVPEIAADAPRITNGGRTYTFTIRKGVRFSTGAPVTARSFAYTINRLLNPAMNSPLAMLYKNIVGAQKVIDGKAATATGVIARGNTLVIRLKKPDGAFMLLVTAEGFCVLPETVPIDPEGVKAPVPAAGPYYVAEYVPGERAVLEWNRYYRGGRPHHIDRFVVDLTLDPTTILDRVESGELDSSFIRAADIGDRAEELRRKYGVNRSRFFVAPQRVVSMFVLNTSRPLFCKNPKLRQAVNFAVDREALLRERGRLSGSLTDQYLTPVMFGFRNERIYPLKGPDLRRARALARGRTRGGKAVLYTEASALDAAQAQILQRNLGAIDLEVEIKDFPRPVLNEKLRTPGEPFDIGRVVWIASPDPSFLNSLFDGRTIGQADNANWSYFNSPKYNRLLEAASRLPAGPERYRTYSQLDVDIARNAAPAIAYAYGNAQTLVSSRTGCVVVNPILDLAAVCLK